MKTSKLLIIAIFTMISTTLISQNNALDFDGTDAYIDISTLNTNGFSGLTIEAWVYAHSFNPISPDNYISNIAGNEDATSLLRIGDNDGGEMTQNDKAQFVITTSTNKKCSGTSVLALNTWYHIAGTYDGTNMRLYVNGILENTVSHSGNIVSTSGHKIGGSITDRYFDGIMDEVRIWNDGRSETEIRENMCNELIGTEDNLVAYYKLNETSGTSAVNTVGNSALDGTLTNMEDADWVDSEAFTTWDGSESNVWANGDNWTDGVPDQYDNVGIPNQVNQPTINSAVVCNNLVVGEGATLTFNYNGSHTIHGSAFVIGHTDIRNGNLLTITKNLYILPLSTLDIDPGGQLTIGNKLDLLSTGTLSLYSTSSGTGSLIINGSLSNSGTITMQRYFPGATLKNWHMVSAPVTDMDISESSFVPGTSDDFYAWSETSPGVWVNYKNTTISPTFEEVNTNDNFQAAKGYLVAYNEANPTKTFSGNLFTGDQTFTLKNSGSKDWTYVTGWNLIGNPYSSSIDWNLATRTQFQDNYAYVYDPNKTGGAGFVNINGSITNAYIASNQGFFVLATAGANNQSFTFSNTIQVHGGSYMKNHDSEEKLILRLSDGKYYDETHIRLSKQSTFNRDREDAYKLFSYDEEIPQLFSLSSDNINLAVNSIPEIATDKNIPLGLNIPKSGVYTISTTEVNGSLSTNGIYLEDLLLDSWNKISESDYSFTTQEGDINNRFIIHFGIVGVEEPYTLKEIVQIWATNSTIYIANPNKLQGKIEILNLFGQKIIDTELDGNSNQQINVVNHIGNCIVSVVTNTYVLNKKICLK